MSAINNGKPLSEIAPRSKIVKSFKEMAEMMFPEEKDELKKKWRLFNR